MRTLRPSILLAASLLITALVYWTGLSGPLVFDDNANLSPLGQWLRGDNSWQWVVGNNGSGRLGRPIPMASFVLNVFLLGPGVWGLKFGNLLVHLLNGVLVFAFFCQLNRPDQPTKLSARDASWLPLLAATLWLIHPLFVSTVLYVVQRMAMLSATFTLLTLLAYISGRRSLQSGETFRATLMLAVAAPAMTIAASLSKENGLLAPALCAMVEWIAFRPENGRDRHWGSKSAIGLALVAPIVIAAGLVFFDASLVVAEYQNRPFTLAQRLLTQPRALWDYVGAFILPVGPRLGLYHDDFPISTGILTPPSTLVAIVSWIAVSVMAWRFRNVIPGFALGLGIFLVGHGLESTIFPLLMYFEHRNYLPGVGLVWALLSLASHGAARLAPHIHNRRGLGIAASLGFVLTLSTATWARSTVWASEAALQSQALRHHPSSRWLRTDLAQSALSAERPDYLTARAHVDALAESTDPSTRRLAGVWQLMIECASDNAAMPASIARAFSGPGTPIEADLLLAYEALAEGVKTKKCHGLPARAAAKGLVDVVNQSPIPAKHYNARRMLFKAAQLYAIEGNDSMAVALVSEADTGTAADAPMAAFRAEIELRQGNLSMAQRLIERLEVQVSNSDRRGIEIVRQLQLNLSGRASKAPESLPNPRR